MAPTVYNKIELYYSLPMLTVMIVYSTYWFIYVMKHSTFRWVQFMLLICVVQNINNFWLAILVYTEVTTFD